MSVTAQSTGNAFDGISATRATGAFEEVFVRRGRWRKNVTEIGDEACDNVVQLAEHVVSGADKVIMDPILEHSNKSACPNTSEFTGDSSDAMLISEITDTIQFVVKNTFLNTAGFVRNSMHHFLSERLVQSCPAGSIDIDDNMNMESVGQDAAANDAMLNTAGSWQNYRTMSFDNAGMMNTAASWHNLRTLSFDDANLLNEALPLGSAFNTASTFGDAADACPWVPNASSPAENAHQAGIFSPDAGYAAGNIQPSMFEQQMLIEQRLNTLRTSGSTVQQSIAEAMVPAMLQSMQPVSLEACFPTPPVGPPAFDTSRLPTPPPPPPSAVLRLAEALPAPEIGSALAPSVGSLLHHCGGCRPCTFFHTRGCQNKETCEFCHLCGPGEKKKRLRQEKAAKRDAQAIAVQNARAILASLDAAEANAELDFIVE